MHGKLYLIFFLGSFIPLNDGASNAIVWDYTTQNGPATWSSKASTCSDTRSASRQSPVKIPMDDSCVYYDTLATLAVNRFDTSISASLINTGTTIQANFDDGHPLTVSGGNLGGTFIPDQFHFHWGSSDCKGSEHTMQVHNFEVKFPLEIHLVTHRNSYANLSEAADKSDGLAVFGVFFVISEANNSVVDTLIDKFDEIMYPGNVSTTMQLNLANIIDMSGDYYRYLGSLTTPACYESVTWTVFKDPITISSYQMTKFRSVFDKNGAKMEDNWRPVQRMNYRKMYRSFKTPSELTSKAGHVSIGSILLVTTFALHALLS